jgi:hypothetical protein
MSSIIVKDLPEARTLNRRAMSAVSGGAGIPGVGGNSWLQGLGPVANVNVNVNQSLTQLQYVNVEALNNSFIGPGVKLPSLNVSPQLIGMNAAAV